MLPTREQAFALLSEYNQEPFHIRHAETVERVMRWFSARDGEDAEYWGLVGLLHDLDFERYPEEHCVKVQALLREHNYPEEFIRAVASHGYGMTGADIAPERYMEKVLFAVDELTGLIWSAALVRPSKSCRDMELSSLRKKYKNVAFAAGCSRETIAKGAEMLGWTLDELLQATLTAMAETEVDV
jgi:predicted hydrolase (HD superfamily)